MSVNRFWKTNAEQHQKLFSKNDVSSSNSNKTMMELLVKSCRLEAKRMTLNVEEARFSSKVKKPKLN